VSRAGGPTHRWSIRTYQDAPVFEADLKDLVVIHQANTGQVVVRQEDTCHQLWSLDGTQVRSEERREEECQILDKGLVVLITGLTNDLSNI